jgi:hypothetical protein
MHSGSGRTAARGRRIGADPQFREIGGQFDPPSRGRRRLMGGHDRLLILAFWAVLVWLWAHPEWFAPRR